MVPNVEEIDFVYSGKPGCGCGCRGKYWTDQRNIKRIANIMAARADEVRERDGIHFIEDEARYYWAHVKRGEDVLEGAI